MKILRTFPDPSDEVELVGELVKGWCAFAGASESVWASMGPERREVEVMRGSALEVSLLSLMKTVTREISSHTALEITWYDLYTARNRLFIKTLPFSPIDPTFNRPNLFGSSHLFTYIFQISHI